MYLFTKLQPSPNGAANVCRPNLNGKPRVPNSIGDCDGNGPIPLTFRIRGSRSRQARWANTMESSSSTRWFCVGRRSRRLRGTAEARIGTFFIRIWDGNLRALDWLVDL